MKEATETDKTVKPIQNFGTIILALTFEDYETMKLSVKRMLNKDVQESKQYFLGLSDEAQEPLRREYRAKTLAQQIIDFPINLPNFEIPEIDNDELIGTRKALFDYFMLDENEELLDWFWAMYQKRLYPKELLSNPSE